MSCPNCGGDHSTTALCPSVYVTPKPKTDLQRIADALENIAESLDRIEKYGPKR